MAEVFLNPSTQHLNIGNGSVGTPQERSDLIAGVVCTELSRHNVVTMISNSSDTTGTTVAAVNQAQPTIYVAIGTNRGNGTQKGGNVYYHIPSMPLAEDISYQLNRETPSNIVDIGDENYSRNRGAHYDLRNVTVPGVNVLVGFLDNEEDALFIAENTYELGVAISRGILDYLNIAYNENTPEATAQMQQKFNGVYFN